jgi:hypothetical protein
MFHRQILVLIILTQSVCVDAGLSPNPQPRQKPLPETVHCNSTDGHTLSLLLMDQQSVRLYSSRGTFVGKAFVDGQSLSARLNECQRQICTVALGSNTEEVSNGISSKGELELRLTSNQIRWLPLEDSEESILFQCSNQSPLSRHIRSFHEVAHRELSQPTTEL